ncbi:MAG: hypothetical protein N3B12_03760 [Armatimonadetes bacterium]|nr:hypothetical protein [Armatimonadota bacterium]
MRYIGILFFAVACVCGCAFADDIVTMPTANQLKAGELDVAAYYIDLDFPSQAPQFIQYQTLYLGLTDRFELDIHRASVDKDETSVVLVGSVKLLNETPTVPDLVFGVRNFNQAATTLNPAARENSKDPSVFLSAAKTFFFNPMIPGPPLVRAHLSLGSADRTLFGEERHKGLFGGLQFLIAPWIGAVIENDGADTITGVTIMPPNTGLTIKGGTFGDHTWIGLAWRTDLF